MGRAWLFPLLAALAALLVALLGATVMDPGDWYHGLTLPRWAPPDYAYGMIWIGVFATTLIAAITAWRAVPAGRETDWLAGLLALSGFLTILWSLLFFRLHRPDWATLEAIVLWVSIAGLIVFVWRRSMLGAVMLLPFLAWVTFAGYLGMTIVRLNGAFS